MISYLFTVKEKRMNWDKVEKYIQKKTDDYEMILAVDSKNPDLEEIKSFESEKFKVLVFENKTQNQMIEKALEVVDGDSLLLCRDEFLYTDVMASFLIGMGELGAQVVMFRKNKKTNKVKKFFAGLKNKFIKTFFNFDLYEGDTGMMFFNNIALSVLKETKGVLLTKVNRFVGFEISYAEIDDLEQNDYEKHEKKALVKKISIVSSILACLIVAFGLLVGFKLIGFIISTLFVVSFIGLGFWILYLSLKLSIINKVGDLK